MRAVIPALLALALLTIPTAAQSQEREQKPPTSGDAIFIVIPQAGKQKWALLLNTRTGATWRSGFVGEPNPNNETPRPGQWFWVPIEICDDCR